MTFSKIAVFAKKDIIEQKNTLINFLTMIKIEVILLSDDLDIEWNTIDLAIIIGGDGTFLSISRKISNYNIPIVGINQGKLGFITDVSSETMINAIASIIIDSKYVPENRMMLTGSVFRDSVCINSGLALNDVVISRGAIGNMIEILLSIDSCHVFKQKSDGLIISTPTGSTAYSLSAGGPIIHPTSEAISIVSICPQSLSNCPLIVNNRAEIELTVNNLCTIHYDGQECFALHCFDKIIIKKSVNLLTILHPENYDYYNTLRDKLGWSKQLY